MTETTRADHMKWCKQRAAELLDEGDWEGAWASMVSDLGKHPETAGHTAIMLGMMLLAGGHNANVPEMRTFIEGFN